MQAVRWHGNRDVRHEPAELSLPLGPGMVEAEVVYCGICGSDVAEYAYGPFAIRPGRLHALTGQEPPLTLGHEFSARIVGVGEGVEDIAVRAIAFRPTPAGAASSARPASPASTTAVPRAARSAWPRTGRSRRACASPPTVSCRSPTRCPTAPARCLSRWPSDSTRSSACTRARGKRWWCSASARSAPAPLRGHRRWGSTCSSASRATSGARGPRSWVTPCTSRGREAGRTRSVRERTGGGAQIVVDASGVPAALEAAPDMTRRGGRIAVVGLRSARRRSTPPASCSMSAR